MLRNSSRCIAARRRVRPLCETLEGRQLLAADPGYALSGASWANPAHITYSFAPDGVFWDHALNTLQADFSARFPNRDWHREIARALQTWATVANVNVVPVGDSAASMDAPGQSQGDPRFGDIRIGGYRFNNATTLAETYFPPPAGSTMAGDTEINTEMDYKLGSDFDLYSAMLHEFGHSLGLLHSPSPTAVMHMNYQGVRGGLSSQDVAGIRAIYGARNPDVYQAQGLATSPANAADLTAGLDALGRETLANTSLATIGDTEVFSVVAPAGATGLRVAAVASGVSSLSPALTILDSSLTPLGSAADPASWGNSALVSVSDIVPGRRYYVQVTGATNDVFAVGAYDLGIAFNIATPATAPVTIPTSPPVLAATPPTAIPETPALALAPTAVAPTAVAPILADRYEPNNTIGQATPLGSITQAQVEHLTLQTAGEVDFFQFQAAKAGLYRATASGMTLRIYDSYGRQFGEATGTVLFRVTRAGQKFSLSVSSASGTTAADYSLTVGVQQAAYTRSVPRKAPSGPVRFHSVSGPAQHPAGPHRFPARANRKGA